MSSAPRQSRPTISKGGSRGTAPNSGIMITQEFTARLFLFVACLWPLWILALFGASSNPIIHDTSGPPPVHRLSLRSVLDRVDIMGYGPTHPRVAFVVVGEEPTLIKSTVESVLRNTDLNRVFLICAVFDGQGENPNIIRELAEMDQGSVPHWHGVRPDIHAVHKTSEEESHSRKIHTMFNEERVGITGARMEAVDFIKLLEQKHLEAGLKSLEEDLIVVFLQAGAQLLDRSWLPAVTHALIVPPPLFTGNEERALKLANAVSFRVEQPGMVTAFDEKFAPVLQADAKTEDINSSSGASYGTPTFNGAGIAMRLDTFVHLPAQDPSLMDPWPANLELALNLWLCADGIDIVQDAEISTANSGMDTLPTVPLEPQMAARFAAVWMDEPMQERFFQAYSTQITRLDWDTKVQQAKQSPTFPKGDMARRCRPFEWYANHVNSHLTKILEQRGWEDEPEAEKQGVVKKEEMQHAIAKIKAQEKQKEPPTVKDPPKDDTPQKVVETQRKEQEEMAKIVNDDKEKVKAKALEQEVAAKALKEQEEQPPEKEKQLEQPPKEPEKVEGKTPGMEQEAAKVLLPPEEQIVKQKPSQPQNVDQVANTQQGDRIPPKVSEIEGNEAKPEVTVNNLTQEQDKQKSQDRSVDEVKPNDMELQLAATTKRRENQVKKVSEAVDTQQEVAQANNEPQEVKHPIDTLQHGETDEKAQGGEPELLKVPPGEHLDVPPSEQHHADDTKAQQDNRPKPKIPLRQENLDIVQKAKPIDLSFVPVAGDHSSHPHMGAKDENGEMGYIHDETSLRNYPPPFAWSEQEEQAACSMRDNNWKMMTQRVFVDMDEDRQKNEAGVKRDKIFCLVYTIESAHSRIPAIQQTWGPKCDGFMVGSTKTDKKLSAVEILHDGPEEYNNIWQKVRSMWSYIYDNYYEKYDWFHIGGDDLFLIVENLRLYLESEEIRTAANGGIYLPFGEETTQTPLVLGRRFAYAGNMDDIFNSGGSGYTMNKAALKLLVTEGFPNYFPNAHTFSEDTMVAKIFRKLGVFPYDTKDEDGGERYMPFLPGHHWGYRLPKDSSEDWYAKYSINIKEGPEHCSPKSVAFHYVKDEMMKRLYALAYGLCPEKYRQI